MEEKGRAQLKAVKTTSNIISDSENITRKVTRAYNTIANIPTNFIDNAFAGLNNQLTQGIEGIERGINLDPSNAYVKNINYYTKFVIGIDESPFLWTAEAPFNVVKLASPFTYMSLGVNAKDAAMSFFGTPEWQNALSGIQENPYDVFNNVRNMYFAGWSADQKIIMNMYNEITKDPYICGQTLGKTEIDIGMFFIGGGESTATSNIAKADLAVADTGKAADAAASIEKIATSPVDDIMKTEVASISPNEIRFSQSSVNGVNEITKSMETNGWVGEPVDVVKMSDGQLTTVDNTRVLAANNAGINVESIIHVENETIPLNDAIRFISRNGEIPDT